MKEFVRVYLDFYRVAPKGCAGHSSLAAIAACSRELSQSGLGIKVRLDERRDWVTGKCAHETPFPFWRPYCETCWRAVVAATDERREIVDRIADRFEVETHGNGPCRSRHPVYLHIHRGDIGKKHIALAKKVLGATATAFKRRGYEVAVDGETV